MDMEKVAIGIGAVITPIQTSGLEYVDAWLAGNAKNQGKIKVPEQYPLYSRPAIMIPLIAGAIATPLGLFGDKYIGKTPALFATAYGIGSLTGGLVNLAKAMSARADAGVEVIFPDPTKVPTPTKYAQRTVSYVYPLTTIAPTPPQAIAPSAYAPPTDTTEETLYM
jgi:hypothetical protein